MRTKIKSLLFGGDGRRNFQAEWVREPRKPFDYNFPPFNFQYEYLKIFLFFRRFFCVVAFSYLLLIRSEGDDWASGREKNAFNSLSLLNWKEIKIRSSFLLRGLVSACVLIPSPNSKRPGDQKEEQITTWLLGKPLRVSFGLPNEFHRFPDYLSP